METKSIALTLMANDQPEEGAIVRKAQSGDLDAFELLIRRHERQVFGLCYHMLGNLEDAKDAAQDVFLKLHQQLSRFDYEREFTPWLLTVVMNLCRDRMRSRRPHEPLDDSPLIDVAKNPEVLARFSEQWALLKQGIASLPERERAALELRELEEMTSAEVALRLGVTEATVRGQVSNAKLKLKAFMRNVTGRQL